MLIAAEKLNFENFNDVIRAYRKFFWKKLLKHAVKKAVFQCQPVHVLVPSFKTLSHQCGHTVFAHTKAPCPDVYMGIFIFFLWSLCKRIGYAILKKIWLTGWERGGNASNKNMDWRVCNMKCNMYVYVTPK